MKTAEPSTATQALQRKAGIKNGWRERKKAFTPACAMNSFSLSAAAEAPPAERTKRCRLFGCQHHHHRSSLEFWVLLYNRNLF